MFLEGKLIVGFASSETTSVTVPPRPPELACSDIMAATIVVVVASSVRRASVGALGACQPCR